MKTPTGVICDLCGNWIDVETRGMARQGNMDVCVECYGKIWAKKHHFIKEGNENDK